jgi:hypothetical protein
MFKRVLFIKFLLLSASAAIADTGYFGGAGQSVIPLYNTQIQMIDEHVIIYPFGNKWKAECEFIFYNTGPAETVQMGFPDFPNGEWEYMDSVQLKRDTTIKQFKCYIDCNPVEWSMKIGIKEPSDTILESYPRVFTWKVQFDEKQTRKNHVSYIFEGDRENNDLLTLTYVLRTGALWKGPISNGTIKVVLNLLDSAVVSVIKPEWYKIYGDTIVWEFSNLEPKQNIYITTCIFAPIWYQEAKDALKRDSLVVIEKLMKKLVDGSGYEGMGLTSKKMIDLADKMLLNMQRSSKDTMLLLKVSILLEKREIYYSMLHSINNDLRKGVVYNNIDYRYIAKRICGVWIKDYKLAREILANYLTTYDIIKQPEIMKAIKADYDTLEQDSLNNEGSTITYNYSSTKSNSNGIPFSQNITKYVQKNKQYVLGFLLPITLILFTVIFTTLRFIVGFIRNKKHTSHTQCKQHWPPG